jgi:hypothetical protein
MLMTRNALMLVLTLTLAASAIAVPATALGQSAGDDQYVDPFQNQPNNPDDGEGNSGSQGGDQQAAPPAEGGDATTQTTSPSTAVVETTPDGATLPRTGLPLAPVALIGLFLLVSGLALQRRT